MNCNQFRKPKLAAIACQKDKIAVFELDFS